VESSTVPQLWDLTVPSCTSLVGKVSSTASLLRSTAGTTAFHSGLMQVRHLSLTFADVGCFCYVCSACFRICTCVRRRSRHTSHISVARLKSVSASVSHKRVLHACSRQLGAEFRAVSRARLILGCSVPSQDSRALGLQLWAAGSCVATCKFSRPSALTANRPFHYGSSLSEFDGLWPAGPFCGLALLHPHCLGASQSILGLQPMLPGW
jgi:hypothetical protein